VIAAPEPDASPTFNVALAEGLVQCAGLVSTLGVACWATTIWGVIDEESAAYVRCAQLISIAESMVA
jgi:hypothetical protein